MQQTAGVKAFLARPVGKILVSALAFVTLLGSFFYLGPFFAAPTFLLFGLAVPIYTGWKRPRDLAILGIAVLILTVPVAAAWDAQEVRVPSPASASDTFPPFGNGSALLTGAQVSPFVGSDGQTFNFTVTVNPSAVPFPGGPPLWLTLYVTSCPGATGNSSPNCGSGYPFHELNDTLPGNLTAPLTETFSLALDGPQIWWWQASTAYYNSSNATTRGLIQVFLDPVNGYGGAQGPVTGDYGSTVSIVLLPIGEALFLFTGLVYFLALVVYLYFRARRARANPPPSPTASPSDAGGPTGTPTVGSQERKCPNCQALVYPNEKACWKCGAALGAAPADTAPLPSGGKPN